MGTGMYRFNYGKTGFTVYTSHGDTVEEAKEVVAEGGADFVSLEEPELSEFKVEELEFTRELSLAELECLQKVAQSVADHLKAVVELQKKL